MKFINLDYESCLDVIEVFVMFLFVLLFYVNEELVFMFFKKVG